MEKLIEVKDLAFKYDEVSPFLFQDINITLRSGEVICISGKSGAGKSTLLRIIANILEPTIGQVVHARRQVPNSFVRCGFVFQDPRLLPWRNIFNNVALPIESLSLLKKDKALMIEEALKKVGLLHLAKRYPHQLSGGQQQRVSLARALVGNPPVLLLDEPFSGLDQETKAEICPILKKLLREDGLGLVLVSHDLEDVDIFGGKLIKIGEVKAEALQFGALKTRQGGKA